MMNKILVKAKILFTNPALFFKIVKDVLKLKLGLGPKTPEGGKRFTTDLEMETLKKYSSQAKVGIVEIGVLDGATTKEMASVAHVPLYGIDPIIPDSMNKYLIGSEEIINRNLAFYKDFFFFKDFSYNVVKNWNKSFDFIFIDGDHTYEAVRQDFEDWYPLTSPGGYIAFHDSAPVTSVANNFLGWEGPIKLVAELKQDSRIEFVETQDSLSVFRKK